MASEKQAWYYSKGGEKVGPFSLVELKKLATQGHFGPNDSVWKSGWEDWKPASSVEGLFSATSSPAPPVPAKPKSDSNSNRAANEKFCESCGKAINQEASICPHCGVKQKSAGIGGFFRKQVAMVKEKIAIAKRAIDEEMQMKTGISMPHKVIAILVAIGAGWSGFTGLGAIVAGRHKAGFAMLGLPLILGLITAGCLTATFVSAIASIFVIGIPFFIIFGTLSLGLLPLFFTTYIGFYIADIMLCIKAE
jgi:RNA polymerase subunit RPABC4/transcription elongation factor Spt4